MTGQPPVQLKAVYQLLINLKLSSFNNQTATLAMTVEETETFVYECVYCNVRLVEVSPQLLANSKLMMSV